MRQRLGIAGERSRATRGCSSWTSRRPVDPEERLRYPPARPARRGRIAALDAHRRGRRGALSAVRRHPRRPGCSRAPRRTAARGGRGPDLPAKASLEPERAAPSCAPRARSRRSCVSKGRHRVRVYEPTGEGADRLRRRDAPRSDQSCSCARARCPRAAGPGPAQAPASRRRCAREPRAHVRGSSAGVHAQPEAPAVLGADPPARLPDLHDDEHGQGAKSGSGDARVGNRRLDHLGFAVGPDANCRHASWPSSTVFFVSVAAGVALIRDDEQKVDELALEPAARGRVHLGQVRRGARDLRGDPRVHIGFSMLCAATCCRGGNAEFIGPFSAANYLRPMFVFGLPLLVLFTGSCFAIGGATRLPVLVFSFPDRRAAARRLLPGTGRPRGCRSA